MTNKAKHRLKELKKTPDKNNRSYTMKQLFNISMNNYRFVLMDMLFDINGIDKDEYLFSDGFSLEYDFSFDDKFKEMSKLGFNKKEKNDINGIKFRGRFVTKLLFFFMKHIDDIIDTISEESNSSGESKWKIRYNILNEIIIRLNSFVVSYLRKDIYYEEHLEKILEIFMIYRKKEKSVDVFETFKEQKEFVKHACKTMEYDEDIMINNICKLAYVMSTENMKLKECPKLEEGMTRNDYYSVKEQIADLGYAILKRRCKEKEHPIYKMFTKANPRYYSKYPEVNDEYEINIGIKALMYLKFLIDDKNVDRFIDKLVAF